MSEFAQNELIYSKWATLRKMSSFATKWAKTGFAKKKIQFAFEQISSKMSEFVLIYKVSKNSASFPEEQANWLLICAF